MLMILHGDTSGLMLEGMLGGIKQRTTNTTPETNRYGMDISVRTGVIA